jgi:NIMA (never in mitosis gene a)-related kinase
MSSKDFEEMKELGKGAFASVFMVRKKSSNKMYALKKIQLSKATNKHKDNALNEIRLLASISHPHIIGYRESFYDTDNNTLNIVMELADQGDLQSKISTHKNIKIYISEKEIWSYLVQILQGMKVLHDNKIMHRDLKSANIFLKNGQIKLGDFNVSKELNEGFLNTQTGTPYYASPEVWSEKPYDFKSDIWSVGCIIYELCALKLPFRGRDIEALYTSIMRGSYEPIPSIYSKDLNSIVNLMLKSDPTKRLSCDDLLAHSLIMKRNKVASYKSDSNLIEKLKWPEDAREVNNILPKVRKYSSNNILKFEKENNIPNIKYNGILRKSPLLNKKAEERINIVEKNSKGLLRNPDYLDYRYNIEKKRMVSASRAKSDNIIISLKNDNALLRK